MFWCVWSSNFLENQKLKVGRVLGNSKFNNFFSETYGFQISEISYPQNLILIYTGLLPYHVANVLCNRKFITHQIEHGDRKYLYYLIQPKNIRDHHFQSFPDILYPGLYPGLYPVKLKINKIIQILRKIIFDFFFQEGEWILCNFNI